jgi:hypothetical protein
MAIRLHHLEECVPLTADKKIDSLRGIMNCNINNITFFFYGNHHFTVKERKLRL